jgi:DNA polymerase elongation subunit (family B)
MSFYTNVYYNGSTIFCREINGDKRLKDSTKFESCLYIPTDKPTKMRSISGRPVDRICFNSSFESLEFKKKYDNVKDFDIHGDIGVEYQYISSEYGTECEYDFSKIRVLYIDIETTCEDGFPEIDNPKEKVIAVTCKIGDESTVFCLGEYKATGEEIVNEYDNEKELLYDVIQYFQRKQPDVITGWNIRFFDIPYLVNRIKSFEDSELQAKKLSPWDIIKEKKVEKSGKEYTVFELIGISTLDYFELYKTFTYVTQESYKLDHIAWVELGERKISYEEYESISDFYKKNFQKFIEYNIKDVDLVQRLEQKMRLMELAVALAYSAGVNYMDVFSQVRTWDVIIYNHLLKKNIVIPPKRISTKNDQYAGAYVKEPLIGMHNWVVSFDIASMYPSSIMQFNISPETLIDHVDIKLGVTDITKTPDDVKKLLDLAKQEGFGIAANGTCFTNKKHGFLPELMDKMYKERKEFKNKMIEAKKDLEAINNELKKRGLQV